MKKFAIFAAACAVVLSMSSCDKTKGTNDQPTNDQSEEYEAVYDDEAYDIDELNVIDPYDEEAYNKYCSTAQDENTEEYTGPSDVDMVDIVLTEPYHVDMLLDQFDYDINNLAELYSDKEGNATAIDQRIDHITRITDKMDEAIDADLCTLDHLVRFQQLADKYFSLMNENH